MRMKMLRKAQSGIAAGYLDTYPGEVFRMNGDQIKDLSANNAQISSLLDTTVDNGAILIGTYDKLTSTTLTKGQLEFLVGQAMDLDLLNFSIEGEFLLPENHLSAYYDVFTIGTYNSALDITFLKWGNSRVCSLMLYGPTGTGYEIQMPAGVIPYGVRFKLAVERYNGMFYFYINDEYYSGSQRIAATVAYNYATKKIRFGSDAALGKTNQLIYNFRMVKDAVFYSDGLIIYGSQYSDTTGSAKQALDEYITASSYWYPATSDTNNTWIGLNHKKPVICNQVNFIIGGSGSLISYLVEYSDDGVVWNTALEVTNKNYSTGGNITDEFPAIRAKCWRFRILSSSAITTVGLRWIRFGRSANYIPSKEASAIFGNEYSATSGAAKNAFDGISGASATNSQTWFPYNAASIADAWVGLSYADAKPVNRAVIDMTNHYYSTLYVINGFVIEYWTGSAWAIAYDSGVVSYTNQTLTVDFPEITAKRWRFRMTNCPNFKNKEVTELSFLKV